MMRQVQNVRFLLRVVLFVRMVGRMEQIVGIDAGHWLNRRDKWMREVIASAFLDRNAKLAGIYLALRMSAKRPYTYPAMATMGKDLGVSLRQVARAMKELEDEGYVRVKRNPGHSSVYSLQV